MFQVPLKEPYGLLEEPYKGTIGFRALVQSLGFRVRAPIRTLIIRVL